MEAKELMINDLVWYVDEPIKVKHNYGKSVRYDDDHCSHEVEQSYIKPIPLTEEILKANGFESKGSYYQLEVDDNAIIYNSVTHGFRIFVHREDIHIHVDYVHQLQHALRLCGLDDLADNFKVS